MPGASAPGVATPDHTERLAHEAVAAANARVGYERFALTRGRGAELHLSVMAEFTGASFLGGTYHLPHDLDALLTEVHGGAARYLTKRPAIVARLTKKAGGALPERPTAPTTVATLSDAYAAQRALPDGAYPGPLRCEDGLTLPHDARVTTVVYPCGQPATERVQGHVYCRQHAKLARRAAAVLEGAR